MTKESCEYAIKQIKQFLIDNGFQKSMKCNNWMFVISRDMVTVFHVKLDNELVFTHMNIKLINTDSLIAFGCCALLFLDEDHPILVKCHNALLDPKWENFTCQFHNGCRSYRVDLDKVIKI